MLARKYTISTLVIALAVFIGFTVKNPENMALNAAYSNTSDNESITVDPTLAQPAETARPVTEERIEAVHDPAPTAATPAVTAKPRTKPSATPKASSPSISPPAAAPSEDVTPTATPAPTSAEENFTPAASSTPSVIKAAPEQIREGDDPVPNVKKVNLPSAEIVKIKEQYERIAGSDTNEATWKRKADQLIVKGMSFLGTPYVFGAKGGQTDSFDCSSFLQYLFGSQKVALPRDSRQQSQHGTEVSIDELREGDLVFFTTPKRKNKDGIERIGHVAVYMGNGLMLHTFRPGIGVTVSELDGTWKDRFVKAKRVLS
ncbi:C40 family peptidase [Paenibacillus aceris]|uniref:Cell wall-associated NlpC family hydrolase n=1 Tax=Paenibacillus aceris TaxID=869555 RepID=A0ABS4I4T8_9BACL|nr:C40 family peptidase [Paenibacillus aceris]MBP1965124.1 cell wall-associated NlpC family hydrolase [Paenibacillus aceris]NHW33106.1 hypothetical protein [Paenibacillus aceris]